MQSIYKCDTMLSPRKLNSTKTLTLHMSQSDETWTPWCCYGDEYGSLGMGSGLLVGQGST